MREENEDKRVVHSQQFNTQLIVFCFILRPKQEYNPQKMRKRSKRKIKYTYRKIKKQ